jgi:hypothetical protein
VACPDVTQGRLVSLGFLAQILNPLAESNSKSRAYVIAVRFKCQYRNLAAFSLFHFAHNQSSYLNLYRHIEGLEHIPITNYCHLSVFAAGREFGIVIATRINHVIRNILHYCRFDSCVEAGNRLCKMQAIL